MRIATPLLPGGFLGRFYVFSIILFLPHRCCATCLMYIISSNAYNNPEGNLIIFVLQMQKQRVINLTESYKVSKWQSWALNPGTSSWPLYFYLLPCCQVRGTTGWVSVSFFPQGPQEMPFILWAAVLLLTSSHAKSRGGMRKLERAGGSRPDRRRCPLDPTGTPGLSTWVILNRNWMSVNKHIPIALYFLGLCYSIFFCGRQNSKMTCKIATFLVYIFCC